MTTPSALSKVASQHLLDAQRPLLSQEGTTVRLNNWFTPSSTAISEEILHSKLHDPGFEGSPNLAEGVTGEAEPEQ
jgi:hypothetical protein